jgi:hypothetical protein
MDKETKVPTLSKAAVMPRLSKIDNTTSNGLFSWILKDDRNADQPENNSAMIRVLVKRYNEIADLLNEK